MFSYGIYHSGLVKWAEINAPKFLNLEFENVNHKSNFEQGFPTESFHELRQRYIDF